jgi:hypothetical protein
VSSAKIVDPSTNNTLAVIANDIGWPGPYPSTPVGLQTTASESHPDWWLYKHKKLVQFPGDVGGEFITEKRLVYLEDPSHYRVKVVKPYKYQPWYNVVAEYSGPLSAVGPAGVPLPDRPSLLRDLNPLGSTAIARCKPTNEVAHLANFLAELYRDGLPKLFGATLWQSNTALSRSAGEEYLNSEFGWKPMISDVHDIFHAVTHANAVLEQYERGSGSLTRRRYEFPLERTQTDSFFGYHFGDQYPWNQYLYDEYAPLPTIRKMTTTYSKVWFSGAFTYHLPTDYRSRNALLSGASKAKKLLGLNLTPEVLWNAAPWTWAIDWFSNAGDVVSNISDWATDGLVLKYGYVMEHSLITDKYYIDGESQLLADNVTVSPVLACIETKRRVRATPFGFGLSWSGLSPRQIAISAALGLTHH